MTMRSVESSISKSANWRKSDWREFKINTFKPWLEFNEHFVNILEQKAIYFQDLLGLRGNDNLSEPHSNTTKPNALSIDRFMDYVQMARINPE